VLSRRVEQLERGEVVESGEGGLGAILREGGRSLVNEAQRTFFFLSVWILLTLVGVIVPGGQIVAPPALVIFTILFLPLEYAGFVLDRRQVPFRQRRAWVLSDLPRMASFGAAAFAACFVPFLNLLMFPGLVVAGTLLALRYPPLPEGGDPIPS
jgi:CysZ protein